MRRWSNETAIACCLAALGVALAGSQAGAAERELAAHQHGHGLLNIAIEGKSLWIELETPGADIVGFEHPARSDEDKAAINKAKGRLSDPIGLFGIPAAASCTLEEVSVTPVGYALDTDDDHHDEDDGHDHDEHEEAHEDEDHGDHEEAHEDEMESHAEFHAEYRLQCADPAAITSLTLTYFDVFPGAEELEVTLVTDDGQGRQEVTPAEPVVNLDGD
ncbi:MAG: DUF2796 domain-containing protein [Rhodospirillales bacterium]|nr:DUF2796 domain-containing protein [Rhodospirillales bacterium]